MWTLDGWVVDATTVPLYPWERSVTHCTRGWVGLRAGLVGAENLAPTGIWTPDRPSRSESLYRLDHPGPLNQHTCGRICMFVYIGFKTFFYVVRHLDSIDSCLPTGLHLGFFRSWPSLFLPSSFSSVFLVLSFVSASTSMLFWVVFLLPFFEHGHTMWAGSVQSLL